jgi:MoaA/NifB/PqqE/SkfB family radical SAM enzyme
MLTRETIYELSAAVEMAAQLGVDEVYLTNIDYIFDLEVDGRRAFSWGGDADKEYARMLRASRKQAARRKLAWRECSLAASEQAVCELDPNRFAFVTVEGEIVPCAYLARRYNPRVYDGKLHVNPRKSFGNITRQGFCDIWVNPSYVSFRKAFANREAACNETLRMLSMCDPSFSSLNQIDRVWSAELRRNPLPPECIGCPKAYGV